MAVLGLPMVRVLSVLGLMALVVACGAEATTPSTPGGTPATAAPPPAPPTPAPREPISPPLVSPRAPAPSLDPTVAPPPDPTAAAVAAYRLWMEEARALHPYSEPIERMWDVMVCESSGNATVVAGAHHGLFQYSAATWSGSWNPYRDQPILDPRAQIFATAKAWQDGHQSWWGCY